MIKTKIEDPVQNFYSKYFMFSYSSLNKLLHSPQLFYNWYVLKERRESLESHLLDGKAIHCLLLEKDSFDKQFLVMPGNLPSTNNKKLTEAMYKIWKNQTDDNKKDKLNEFEKEILEWLVQNNLHQSLVDDKDLSKQGTKTGDEKRIEKVLDTKSLDYFEYLKKSKVRDVIDSDALDRCKEAVIILKDHKTVVDLLKLDMQDFELIEVYNENALECALFDFPFGLKGIIDNYVINHLEKRIYITDLKTTGKTIKEFHDSVIYYKYWMQAAIYVRLVQAQHPELKDYEIVFHFVVIDKYNQVYPFPVSKDSMLEWQSQLDEILTIAKYHYVNKNYKLPYEFALDQVTL